MILDDGDRARLTVAAGLLFGVIAVLLVSIGWALLAAATVATGWFLPARHDHTEETAR